MNLKLPLRDGSAAPVTVFGIPIKAFVLVMLVFQNAGAVLLMRYSRASKGQGEFVTYTAVIMQEVLKMMACVIILLRVRINLYCFFSSFLLSHRPMEHFQASMQTQWS